MSHLKSLLLLLTTLFSLLLPAQEIYFGNTFLAPEGIGSINLADNCEQNFFLPLGDVEILRGMGIMPDGTFYAIIRNTVSNQDLFTVIDLENAAYTVINTISASGILRDMAISPAGEVYLGNTGNIVLYDIETNQLTTLGIVGDNNTTAQLVLGLTFVNEALYAAIREVDDTQKVFEVNLDNPSDSRLITELTDPDFNQVGTLTTVSNGCGDTQTYIAISQFGGHRLYEIDLETGELDLVCDTDLPNFKVSASITETAISDCSPNIDLDADDSTTDGINYLAPNVCLLDSFCLFQDTDLMVTSNFTVDSIQIFFSDLPPDDNAEGIFCKNDNVSINCDENIANGITLYNNANLDDVDLVTALMNSIYYQNTLSTPTAGVRNIAVVAFDSTFVSDTALLSLSVVVDVPTTEFVEICEGDSYLWNGVTLSSDTLLCTTGTNILGCDSTYCLDVSVITNQIEIDGNITFCEGSVNTLSVSPIYATYNWSTGAMNATINITEEGVYALTVTDDTGCSAENELEVFFNNTLNGEALATNVACLSAPNGTISINNITGGTAPYLLAINGGVLSENSTFTNLDVGTYEVLVEDANGCELRLNVPINSESSLSLVVEDNYVVNLGEELLVNLQTNANVIQDVNLNTPDNYELIANNLLSLFPAQSGIYELSLTDETGCSVITSFSISVAIPEAVFAPNIFSPNDDGVNDLFQIFTTSAVRSVQAIKVFNRWGGLVFKGNNNLSWNGRVDNELAETGVYTFFVDFTLLNGEREIYEGSVLLIR